MRIYTEERKFILERRGTCQLDRISKALTQNSKIIDSRSIDEQIVSIYLYTDILQYYDLENNPIDSNIWSKFFENDDSVIFSLIINTNLDRLKEDLNPHFISIERKHTISENDKEFIFLFKILKQLIIIINYWYKNLSEDNNIKPRLENIITKELEPNLTKIYNTAQTFNKENKISSITDFCEFLDKIKTENTIWNNSIDHNTSTSINIENVPKYIYHLIKYSLEVIFSQISNLQTESKIALKESFKSQNHTPNMALILAFLMLMEDAKKNLNSIPQRVLENYYIDTLKFRKKNPIADTAYINFALKKNLKAISIPNGTLLLAGKDMNDKEINFITTENLIIEPVSLNKIHTVQIEEMGQLIPNNSPTKKWILSKTYKDNDLSKDSPLPLDKSVQTINKMGLIIASPSIHLPAGNRVIVITLTLTKDSFETFTEKLKTRIAKNPQNQIANDAQNLFNINLSTYDGWYAIPNMNYTFTISKILGRSLDLTINLPNNAPPIIPFEKQPIDIPSGIYSPVIKILLNESMGLEYFNTIENLEILKINIESTVTNYRNISASNDSGAIDTSKPFLPFGNYPKNGSSLFITNKSLASFNLKSLSLNIDWANLPDNQGGFREYYNEYPTIVNNNTFAAKLSILINDDWIPIESNRQIIKLFDSENPKLNGLGKLSNNTRQISIDLDALNINGLIKNYSLITENSKNGIIRLELTGSKMAFGHADYPDLLKKITINNINKNKKDPLPEPNKAYTPEIKSIWLNYSLKSEIIFNNNTNNSLQAKGESMPEQIFKITLFGFEEFILGKLSTSCTLLSEPEYIANKSSVYIGLENLKCTYISLHVQIDENSVSNDIDLHPPQWQYLSNNQWQNFNEKDILQDNTNNLIQSGIIKLSFPKTLDTSSPIMYGDNLSWIRIINPHKEAGKLPTINGIYVNATTVKRVLDEDENNILSLKRVQSQSINKILSQNYPSIQSINQPFESTNDVIIETDEKFYIRASERLRHKNRPSSIWDYEKIILDKFPDIFIAKCINHTDISNAHTITLGAITIVVAPKYTDTIHTPTASKHLLKNIKDYLVKISSPFVKIEVINPDYDEIRVLIDLKLKPNYEKGLCVTSLQEDLQTLLSPWTLNEETDKIINSTIYPSDIFGYIMNKEYVDSINKFSLLKYTKNGAQVSVVKIDSYDSFITATYPWSIIVSAKNHIISINNTIDFDQNRDTNYHGVANMAINKDFLIGPWQYGKRIRINNETKDKDLQESLEPYFLGLKRADDYADKK